MGEVIISIFLGGGRVGEGVNDIPDAVHIPVLDGEQALTAY